MTPDGAEAALDWLVRRVDFLDPGSTRVVPNDQQLMAARIREALATHSQVAEDSWYAMLDPGIRFAVRVLHARGIETGQSCEGGEGHSYDRPTIDLWGNNSHPTGFAALAALEDYGLRVRDVALLWEIDKGVPYENFWRLTLWQPWPERADEVPAFEWAYRATGTRPARDPGEPSGY